MAEALNKLQNWKCLPLLPGFVKLLVFYVEITIRCHIEVDVDKICVHNHAFSQRLRLICNKRQLVHLTMDNLVCFK